MGRTMNWAIHLGARAASVFRAGEPAVAVQSKCSPKCKLRIAGLFALVCAISQSAHGFRTIQPLHFLVEDALLRSVPLPHWNSELSHLALEAGFLLCNEMKRAERASVCEVSFQGAVSVTTFDKTLEDGLRALSVGTTAGDVDEKGLNFLFDQTNPSERRIYVVRRLLSCGGGKGWMVGCTRVSGPATVIAFRWPPSDLHENAITLLHELGHQVGLGDRADPSLLMYVGTPARRLGTGLKAADVAYFRRLLVLP
jgi:hypothetical protein